VEGARARLPPPAGADHGGERRHRPRVCDRSRGRRRRRARAVRGSRARQPARGRRRHGRARAPGRGCAPDAAREDR
jgi:hypothetical protein